VQETFEQWKKKVDVELRKLCGMIGDDLPDVDYYSLYNSGDTPKEAAEYVFQYAQEN